MQRNIRSTLRAARVIVLTVLLAGCSSGIPLVKTPNLYSTSTVDQFERVPPEWRSSQMRVLYGTDRAAEPTKDGTHIFTHQRSMSLEFGVATVTMGDSLTWDQLTAASRSDDRKDDIETSVTQVKELGRFPESNRPPIFIDGKAVDGPELEAENAAAASHLQATLREFLAPAARKEVFLFVHGYNNCD